FSGTTTTPCCSGINIPGKLYATIANSIGCPCLDGMVVPLVYDPTGTPDNGVGWWGQSTACSGNVLTLELACGIPDGTGAHDNCSGFSLFGKCTNLALGTDNLLIGESGTGGHYSLPASGIACACSPFSIVFKNNYISS